MILEAIDTGLSQGARLSVLCERLGVSPRTVQRWRMPELEEDRRAGPKSAPLNSLSNAERARLLEVVNGREFRELPPKQIVPRLADRGVYLASEATVYRLLRAKELLTHRGRSKPRTPRSRPSLVARAPNQVWTWDITYLRGPIRGQFLYLYLVIDLYSRRIMGWEVAHEESALRAAQLFNRTWEAAGKPAGLTLHSDNGGPMKGSTMLATLQRLGVVASFSRPRVSDDNPFSEALFRTLKYVPAYPDRPFGGLEDAAAWVERFVDWYNHRHLHSGINFVTPDERHRGADPAVLAKRHAVYAKARELRPERWSRHTRNWSPAGAVSLSPHSRAEDPQPSK